MHNCFLQGFGFFWVVVELVFLLFFGSKLPRFNQTTAQQEQTPTPTNRNEKLRK